MNDKPNLEYLAQDEWSGSQCDIAPDTCWIDDETGEHVNAETGARTAFHAGAA